MSTNSKEDTMTESTDSMENQPPGAPTSVGREATNDEDSQSTTSTQSATPEPLATRGPANDEDYQSTTSPHSAKQESLVPLEPAENEDSRSTMSTQSATSEQLRRPERLGTPDWLVTPEQVATSEQPATPEQPAAPEQPSQPNGSTTFTQSARSPQPPALKFRIPFGTRFWPVIRSKWEQADLKWDEKIIVLGVMIFAGWALLSVAGPIIMRQYSNYMTPSFDQNIARPPDHYILDRSQNQVSRIDRLVTDTASLAETAPRMNMTIPKPNGWPMSMKNDHDCYSHHDQAYNYTINVQGLTHQVNKEIHEVQKLLDHLPDRIRHEFQQCDKRIVAAVSAVPYSASSYCSENVVAARRNCFLGLNKVLSVVQYKIGQPSIASNRLISSIATFRQSLSPIPPKCQETKLYSKTDSGVPFVAGNFAYSLQNYQNEWDNSRMEFFKLARAFDDALRFISVQLDEVDMETDDPSRHWMYAPLTPRAAIWRARYIVGLAIGQDILRDPTPQGCGSL